MLMVGTDAVEVERSLSQGELCCPACEGVLAPWGHARSRSLRGPEATVRLRPRRARCASCGATHVLLSDVWLLRRADAAVVIGAALEAKATGVGHRPVAKALGLPACTVRGWLRRFGTNAEAVRSRFTRVLHALDPLAAPVVPTWSVFADAVEAIGRASAAVVVRLSPVDPWQFASRASTGGLLSPGAGRAW